MRVERRFLYIGTFLVAIGAVLLSADLRALDTPTLTDAVRLWPLALVAIGTGLVLRRTPAGLGLGVLAALIPGVVLGAGLAVIPRFAGDCGTRGEPAHVATDEGSFDGPAIVHVTGGCGSLTIRTAPGSAWRVDAGSTSGEIPALEATENMLTVDAVGDEELRFLDGRRNALDVTLPTSDLEALIVTVYGGRGDLDLAGARIAQLAVTANASHLGVDASTAAITTITGLVNVGSLRMDLPDDSLTGTFKVGGGELTVCTPPGLGLKVDTAGQPRSVSVGGRRLADRDYESPDYASATNRAELTVHATLGSVEINPIGGCT